MSAAGNLPPPTSGTGRRESPLERADRNWDELLGELRVTQTGVAILFSVLLTVPFSSRFPDIDLFAKRVYLTALSLSAATTVTLIAPVALHRLLFAQGRKPDLVQLSNRFAVVGLGLLCLTLGAVLLLVSDVLLDRPLALGMSGLFTVVTAALWWLPATLARGRRGPTSS